SALDYFMDFGKWSRQCASEIEYPAHATGLVTIVIIRAVKELSGSNAINFQARRYHHSREGYTDGLLCMVAFVALGGVKLQWRHLPGWWLFGPVFVTNLHTRKAAWN
ncbi:hypothetical protein LPJ71_008982, partial [Coemansia sp. S17]